MGGALKGTRRRGRFAERNPAAGGSRNTLDSECRTKSLFLLADCEPMEEHFWGSV